MADNETMLTREDIRSLVLTTLKELGEDLSLPELESADEETRLFGSQSPLDSMGLVNLIADIEDRLSEEYNLDLILANQSAMSLKNSPFRTVGTCIDYILKLSKEADDA